MTLFEINPDHFERDRRLIKANGGRCLPIQGDVADSAASAARSKRLRREWGGIDILVANAGVAIGGSVVDMSEEDWAACSTSTSAARIA